MPITRTVRRRLVAIAVSIAVILGGALLPSPAYATAPCSGVGQQIPGSVTYWNGCTYASAGLRARSHVGTGTVTGSEPVINVYPLGTKVHIWCYLTGSWVTGPNGPTNIWDAVDLYQTPSGPILPYADGGSGVFVVSSDAWIYTGSNNPVVPHC